MTAIVAALIAALAVFFSPNATCVSATVVYVYIWIGLTCCYRKFSTYSWLGYIFTLDFLFAMMVFMLLIGVILRRPAYKSREMNVGILLVVLFLTFHLLRFCFGVFERVPVDSLIRMLYADFSSLLIFTTAIRAK